MFTRHKKTPVKHVTVPQMYLFSSAAENSARHMTSCEVHCLFSFPRLYRTQLCLSTVFLSYKIEDRKKKTGGKQDGITGMRL